MTPTRRTKTLPSSEEVRVKETLSPEDLAVVLGCGRTTAYTILANREIPSFRIGRLRRVRRVDVERYLEAQANAPDTNEGKPRREMRGHRAV
jgi:excisionase family DNA binding protein